MLNLRDPSLIPVPSGTASEDQTCPDLTFVMSHCPTELSNQGGFSDYDGSNLRSHSREGLEGLDHAGSSSHNNIELVRMDV